MSRQVRRESNVTAFPTRETALWRLGTYAEAPDLRYLEAGQAIGAAIAYIRDLFRPARPQRPAPAPTGTHDAPSLREAA